MKKNVLTALLLCVFLVVLLLAVGSSSANSKGAAPAPAKVADSSQVFADRITTSKIPVVVDFWAGWCMPCRFLDPIIEELEKEYKGKVLFMKVDTDIHKVISAYFKVNAIPTVFIIEDKTVRSAFNGVREKKVYKDAIESALKMAAERKEAPPETPAAGEKQ
jgi:thioredoxin